MFAEFGVYSLTSFVFVNLLDFPDGEMLKYCAVCLFQGLFYRVVGGEVSPFRLVRLSAEELLSKEISEWRKPDAPEVNVTSLQLYTKHRSSCDLKSSLLRYLIKLAILQDA